jgi:exopolysaccharide production protein ExoQ
MPPILATTLTLLFIAYLFSRDYRQGFVPSPALWIPCIWLLILGSRSFGEWLSLGTPVSAGGDIAEGSPLDRALFFVLMAIGFMVLVRRRVSLGQLIKNNKALAVFVLYCGISILWSDFPFVAFKRWFKGFGDPIMVLIILEEPEPLKAAEIVLRVCANLLVPTSVLFIKYYPHLGRAFGEWGEMVHTGVTTNKNILGFTLMGYGLFLMWRLYLRWGKSSSSWLDRIGIPLILLGMVGWLFYIADSKTPLLSLGLAAVIFFTLGLRTVRNHITAIVVTSALIFGTLQWSLDIKSSIAEGAGRDATFTGRTEVWEAVLQMQEHPILGYGVDSFWLGDRLKTLQERWYFKPNQAHSGYIEMYLNLGGVGLALFAAVFISYYWNCLKMILTRKEEDWVVFGRLGIAFLFAYLVYNYTEAAFKTPHFLYVIFLLFVLGSSSSWRVLQTAHPSRMSWQEGPRSSNDDRGIRKLPR